MEIYQHNWEGQDTGERTYVLFEDKEDRPTYWREFGCNDGYDFVDYIEAGEKRYEWYDSSFNFMSELYEDKEECKKDMLDRVITDIGEVGLDEEEEWADTEYHVITEKVVEWNEEEREGYHIEDDELGYLEDEEDDTYYLRRSDKGDGGAMLVSDKDKYYLEHKNEAGEEEPDYFKWRWIKAD